MPARSPEVDAIIQATPGARGATLAKLRDLIHEADPQIQEAAKWKKPSNPLGSASFEHDGIVCVAGPLKGRVRLVFFDGSRLPDPKRLFNAQLNGISRAIDFPEGKPIDEPALKALVRAAVKLRASGTTTAPARKERHEAAAGRRGGTATLRKTGKSTKTRKSPKAGKGPPTAGSGRSTKTTRTSKPKRS